MPKAFFVAQNQPNPFTGITKIRYGLPEDLYVNITIYNLIGQKVAILVNENKNAGHYTVRWDGRNASGSRLPNGIFFLRFKAGDYKLTKKLILAR